MDIALNTNLKRPFDYREIASDPGAAHSLSALAIIGTALKLCREAGYTDELHAFGLTCLKDGIRGDLLVSVYDLLAKKRLSDCMALILGVNTGIVSANDINAAIGTNDADLDVKDIVAQLKKRVNGFTEFYAYMQAADIKASYTIDTTITEYPQDEDETEVTECPRATARARRYSPLRLRRLNS